jgi:hypothetical protein
VIQKKRLSFCSWSFLGIKSPPHAKDFFFLRFDYLAAAVSAAAVSAAAVSTGAAAAVSTATESAAASVFFSPQDAKVTIPATKAKANTFSFL